MNFSAMRKQGQLGFFLVDVFMVLLLLLNLLAILFDSLLTVSWFLDAVRSVADSFVIWYQSVVGPRFFQIDLVFIAIFMLEFLVRWVLAVLYRTHHRWFFFPFIHWYDVIGLVPLAGFRVLRLLRVISIALRLQRVGAIDMTNWWPVRFLIKYYGVLIQELTDRVTINIISRVQSETRNGTPVLEHIVDEVVVPRQSALVEWLSHRIETSVGRNFSAYETQLKRYVNKRLHSAIRQNRDVSRIESIPVVGRQVRSTVEATIADIVNRVVSDTLHDLASTHNKAFVSELVSILFEAIADRDVDEQLAQTVAQTVNEALEIVKKHVAIKQWQLRDSAADEEEFRALLRDEFMRVARSAEP